MPIPPRTVFKTVQFLACGVWPSITQTVEHFTCLDHVYDGVPNQCVGMSAYVKGEFMLEPLRYATIWYCFFLLYTGRAYGGLEQLEALEAVRVDLADGELDGSGTSFWMRPDTRLGPPSSSAPSLAYSETAVAPSWPLHRLGRVQEERRHQA